MKSTLLRSLTILASTAALTGCPLKDDLTKISQANETKTGSTENKTGTTENKADTTDTTDSSIGKPKLNSIHLSNNQLAILGENLDGIKNLSIEGVSLKIVSQSKSSIAAEALQALKLVLGATHDLIFTTAYAEEKVSIYVEIPEGLLTKKDNEEKQPRFVMRDGDKVLGYFMNTVSWYNNANNNSAVVMLPTKEIAVVNLVTGKFETTPYIFFASTDCQGTAYAASDSYNFMTILNRIFVARTTGEFFKAVDVKEGSISYASHYDGQYGCRNFAGTRGNPYAKLQPIDPIPDFSSIAPIKIDLE